ncbi:MAG: VOC family protein [Actinobacteria bacterium]|nr:VOC family protein [Actinomycetota bacterium]
MKGQLIHFEIPADDPAKLADFYRTVLGWSIGEPQAGMGDYRLIQVSGDGDAVGGGLYKRTEPDQGRVDYFDVDSIEESAAQVKENGGQVLIEKMAVPQMGYFALCLDPEGNPFGLWLTDENAG